MSTLNIIQTAIIFGSGMMFAGPMGCLLTYAFLTEKVQREEMLRYQREQHERSTIDRIMDQAKKPITFVKPADLPSEVPLIRKVNQPTIVIPTVSTDQVDVKPQPNQVTFTTGPDVTMVQPLTVRTGRHALPTESPLVALNVSLKAGSGGWSVTGRQGVTATDLLSLKAIQEYEKV